MRVGRGADLTRAAFFFFFSDDMMGKEDRGDEGVYKGLEIINDDGLEAEFWMKMRTRGDEEHWEGGRVNGSEGVVKLKNGGQRGNQIRERESNKGLGKGMIETDNL